MRIEIRKFPTQSLGLEFALTADCVAYNGKLVLPNLSDAENAVGLWPPGPVRLDGPDLSGSSAEAHRDLIAQGYDPEGITTVLDAQGKVLAFRGRLLAPGWEVHQICW